MRMFEHRQRFTAIQLHGELGAQLVEARMALQGLEDLPGQWTGIEAHLPVDARSRAEHQVAHIVARCGSRPESGGQQAVDQRRGLVADAADLQIAPVGRLDRTAGKPLGGIGHRIGLIGRDRTAIELDPADPAIQRLDDTQQPRTGRGRMALDIGRSFKGWQLCGKGASRAKARYYACFVRRHEKSARRNGAFADTFLRGYRCHPG